MPAGQLQVISQRDFSGGVNAVASPYDVSQKQVARIRNLILDEHGAMRTRDGFSVITTSPDVTSPIVYRGVLNKNDLSSTPYAIQQAGVNQLYNTSTTPWTLVASFSSAYNTPQTTTVLDQEIIAPGYEVPKIYDGTSLIPITASGGQTVPPGAQHLVYHLGSIWLWNTNASTTTLDGPSSIRMSDINNPNSWPNANQTFIGKDDGQVGMGLATFTIAETGISPTQTLVVFKNYSGYQVTGVFGATNFAVQKIKSDMGCIAPRSIQFVSGYGVIRLTHKGFALYNGVDDRLISEEIRPYIFGQSDIQGLNFSALSRSWASQSQNPPLYVCACPTSTNGLSRLFVYDLVRRGWSICDFPVDFQTLTLFTTPLTQPTVHAGLSTSGRIVSLFAGATDDNGAPIDWSFRTRTHFLGSPTQMSFWRRMLMDVAVTPTQDIAVNATLNGQPETIPATLTFTGTSSGSAWGDPETVWGSFTWGGDTMVDARADMSMLKGAPSMFFDVSGTGKVVIRALDIHARTKPLTRAVM